MTSKQRVTFRLAGTGASGLSSDRPNLAVEVRDQEFALAGWGTMEGGVELEPGRAYFISATLPDGTRVSTHAKLDPDVSEVVLPEPSVAKYPPQPDLPKSPPAADVFARLESIALTPRAARGEPSVEADDIVPSAATPETAAAPWQVGGWRGNLLKSKSKAAAFDPAASPSPPTALRVGGDTLATWSVEFVPSGQTYIQLGQPGVPAWNYAVPLGPGQRCVIRLVRKGKELAIDVALPNSNADLLLRYVGSNLLQEASQAAESRAVLAQDLLAEKFEDPIGAAVGAYALLRFGELDRLQNWTTNLYGSFSWMPDGIAIVVEHLARLGEHQEALSKLLELPQRGLPFFTSGLTYAMNRLRQYSAAVKKGRLSGDVAAIERLNSRLGRYAGFIDVTRPILTFMGTDLRKPSHSPVNR